MKKKPIPYSSEWTFELLKRYDQAIAKIASGYPYLSTYPCQIEVITAEQMMDAYSAVGMPVGYYHWSFGKQFLQVEKVYRRGHMGLAYEMVINSNPCIAYLLEENSMTMQAIVIAHACYGHNSFFKNNYLFTTWTNADSIIDYLLFSKNYIAICEEKYGVEIVEQTLDACHALMNYGVDRYKRPSPISLQEEKLRQQQREEYLQSQVNELWRTLPSLKKHPQINNGNEQFPAEPQENLLYFIEKNAPLLEPWQREIVRIVRKIAQYFYPQRLTKVMNEGWATFWHYTLLNALYDKGMLTDEFMLEFLQAHTNVITQLPFTNKYYNGMNPYALGYAIFTDIRRICETPTIEDKEWFPQLANTDWQYALDFAMRNFKDESFIAQYLSPKLIRDMRLFSVIDDDKAPTLQISAIHNPEGYRLIRQTLADQYNISKMEPNIEIINVAKRSDRSLTLRHIQHNRRPLNIEIGEVMKHLYYLWGFPVRLESSDGTGTVQEIFQEPNNRS